MTLSIKHSFQSLKADGGDTTLVRPSNWNADHTIAGQAKSVMANSAASAGAVSDVLLGDGMWFNSAGKLDTSFMGMVALFAKTTAPTGWLKCNGALVSRVTYVDLFGAIGTVFGAGDGSTTFALPDFRGVFLRGLDDGKGIDTGRALGSFQDHMVLTHNHAIGDPGHTHGVSDPGHAHGVGDPGHYHAVIGSTGTSGSGFVRVDGTANDANKATSVAGTGVYIGGSGTGIGIAGSGTGITVSANGGAENRVKNYALLVCIKY